MRMPHLPLFAAHTNPLSVRVGGLLPSAVVNSDANTVHNIAYSTAKHLPVAKRLLFQRRFGPVRFYSLCLPVELPVRGSCDWRWVVAFCGHTSLAVRVEVDSSLKAVSRQRKYS